MEQEEGPGALGVGAGLKWEEVAGQSVEAGAPEVAVVQMAELEEEVRSVGNSSPGEVQEEGEAWAYVGVGAWVWEAVEELLEVAD